MAADSGLIHLLCGEAAAAVHRKSGLPGRVILCRDSPAVGPWSPDPAQRTARRAAWWGVPEAEIDPGGTCNLPAGADPVLWFGPDPWEQACLLGVLAGLPDGVLPELVPLDRGLARLPPASLPPRFARRLLLEEDAVSAARALWARFLRQGWGALAGEGIPALPGLAPALVRLAEDHPAEGPGRTERQIRRLLQAGVRELPDLLAGLAALEDPRHGAWMGAAAVARLAAKGEAVELG